MVTVESIQLTTPLVISQEEIVETLRREGYSITVRTLGFWRSEGSLPSMLRYGNEYYYDLSVTPNIVDTIRFLANGKRKVNPLPLTVLDLEGDQFIIETVEIIRTPDGLKAALHLRDGGQLVRDIEEEVVDAITGTDEND